MAGSKCNFAEDKVINLFLRNTAYTPAVTVYIALFTADPTETGSLAAEVTGGSYARKAIAFDAPSPSGQTQNTSLITFVTATASWGTVSHWGIMDALTAGNMLYYGNFDVAKAVASGDTAEIAAGEIEIDED